MTAPVAARLPSRSPRPAATAGCSCSTASPAAPAPMRPLAESLANRGYSVELPRLPGHGTSLEDLVAMRWEDWSDGGRGAYDVLAARCSARRARRPVDGRRAVAAGWPSAAPRPSRSSS